MNLRLLFACAALLSLLTSCFGDPTRRINPPTASIQDLTLQTDGSWRMQVRIQNYSTVPMTFSAIDAHLRINAADAGEISAKPDLRIVGESADIVEVTLRTTVKLPTSGDFAYQLKGTISTSEPVKEFKFDRSSRLSPVPGIANTWR